MSDLRPIGTVFDHVFPPVSNTFWMNGLRVGSLSTDGDAFKVFTYEVEAHVEVAGGAMAEQWTPVSGPRLYMPKAYVRFHGWISPVPPPEVIHLLPSDWFAPIVVITCGEEAPVMTTRLSLLEEVVEVVRESDCDMYGDGSTMGWCATLPKPRCEICKRLARLDAFDKASPPHEEE